MSKIVNYLFFRTNGKAKKEKRPRITVMINCEVQTIHPNAFPASRGILYKNRILAINMGKKPKPPFVKVMVKLPITKATNAVPKLTELVSFKENVVT